MKTPQHKVASILALLSLSCWNATAQNLISDPGFEAGTSGTSYEAGSTSLPGWTVNTIPSDGVQLYPASTFGATQPGNTLVLHLTGGTTYAGGGGVSQTIATIPGLTYTVSIDVANRNTASGSCSGNFSFGGQNHAITASSHTFTTLTWTVTASSESTLIDIIANSGASPQLLIDNVSVTPPAVADAANSTVTASPGVVAADGTSTSTITITLLDASNNPVSGKTVTLAQTSGPGTPTITTVTGTTGGAGVAIFTVKSATVGTDVFTATDVTDTNLAITQTATVTFVPLVAWGAATTVTGDTDVATNGVLQYAEHWGGYNGTINGVAFTAAGVNVTKSDGAGYTQTVSWTQGSLSTAYYNLLQGNWYNAINASVTLHNLTPGHPYQVQMWTIDKRYGANWLQTYAGNPAVSTNIGTGQYAIGTFTAVSTAQNIGVSGAGGILNAVVVRDLTPGAGNAANSTVSASPGAVTADGSSTSTITVTLKDATGIRVPGKTISLAQASGPGTAVITTVSAITDANGQATFTVASSTAGVIGFNATDVTDANLAIAQTATVAFVPLVAWGPATTVTDDTDVATNGVLQYAEHWGGSDGTINGVPFTAAGVNVTKSDGAAYTQTVSWTQGSLSTAYYNLLQGNWYNAINASVTLHNLTPGHPYQVQMWSIDKRYGANWLETYSGSPAASSNIGTGQYAIGTFTAVGTAQSIGVSGAGGIINAVAVRDITPGAGDAANSTVIASPAAVTADGSSTSTITVTLKDSTGICVPGKTISLAQTSGPGTAVITTVSDITDANGQATFTVASSTAGIIGFAATDVTDSNIAITQSATVTFTTLVIGGQQFSVGDVLPSPIIAVSGDLLETRVASVTGEIANLRNGTTGTAEEGSTQNPVAVGMTTVTYNLDLTASPSGYDIREIRLFSGWADGRVGQSYRIEYALAASPTTFVVLGTVSAPLATTGSLLTRTYDLTGATILPGVAAIQFVMIDNGEAGSGTVFREIDVLGTTSHYSSWVAGYPALTGSNAQAGANPDGDGLSNLQEFAFGTNPTVSFSGPITYVAGGSVTTPGSPVASNLAVGEGVDFRAVFGRRKDHAAAGLTYTVQFSVDLATWTSSSDTPTVLTGDGAANPSEIEAVSVPYPLFIPYTRDGIPGFEKPTFFRVAVSSN